MGSGVSLLGRRTQLTSQRDGIGPSAILSSQQRQSSDMIAAREDNDPDIDRNLPAAGENIGYGHFSPLRSSSAHNTNNNNSPIIGNHGSIDSPQFQQPSSSGSREVNERESVDMMFRRAVVANAASTDASENSALDTFAHTALSLGMDSEDLLFNMMFFDDGSVPNFGSLVNTLQQETLALHSENNTPYKLNPAKASVLSSLRPEKFQLSTLDSVTECAVCKDEIEDEAEILRVPQCGHYFHAECLMKWISLQAWCPVCRANLESTTAYKASPRLLEGVVEEEISGKEEKFALQHGEVQWGPVVKRLDFDAGEKTQDSFDSSADEKPTKPRKGDGYKSYDTVDEKHFDSDDHLEDSPCANNFSQRLDKSPESSVAEESADQIISAAMYRATRKQIDMDYDKC